ncbi:MAG: metallophosphoesterase [Erysipelotrichaceae bacterium]
MRYVTSDIHGRNDRLLQLLEHLQLQPEDTLYVLGDLIDRGRQSMAVLKTCMGHPQIQVIVGNHEEMLKGALQEYPKVIAGMIDPFLYREFLKLTSKEQLDLIGWLNQLPYFVVFDDYLLVHAGFDPKLLKVALSEQSLEAALMAQKDQLLWVRDRFVLAPNPLPQKIIFGHSPRPYLDWLYGVDSTHPYRIFYDPIYHDKIGMDCGNCYPDGTLACLNLDTMEEIYIS